jgi:hypothetical protein
MDEDGFTFIIDRIKDMINASGFKVYPRRIEEAILEHEAVAEVTVIGIPDDYRGEAPKAFVRLKAGASLTAEDLLAHLEPHLSKLEMPAAIEFRDELPKTMIGKPSKKELREEAGTSSQARQPVPGPRMSTISTPTSSSAHWRSAVTAGRPSRAAVAMQALSPSDRPSSFVRSPQHAGGVGPVFVEVEDGSACIDQPRHHLGEVHSRDGNVTEISLDGIRTRLRQDIGQQRRAIENRAAHRDRSCPLPSREALPALSRPRCDARQSVRQPRNPAAHDRRERGLDLLRYRFDVEFWPRC